MIELLFFCGLIFPSPLNGIICGIQILISVMLQNAHYVFETTVPGAELPDILSFAAVLSCVGVVSCYAGLKNKRVLEQREVISHLNTALSTITRINIGFQEYAVKAGKKTIVTERKRLSREIHDSIGYIITNILMMIKTSVLLVPKGNSKLHDLLNMARLQAEEGIVEIRSALYQMRNKQWEQERGIKALYNLINTFSDATGIDVVTEYGNVDNFFTPEIDLFIYRMLQEGMLNAFKHGKATFIRIHFWQDGRQIQVSIIDNGIGCGTLNNLHICNNEV